MIIYSRLNRSFYQWLRTIFITAACLTLLSACNNDSQRVQGYIEGNMTYLSSSQTGKLLHLNVKRGQWVKSGDILFQIDQQPYLADLKAATASMQEAQANLQNSLTGQRPPELAQIQAQIAATQAELAYANKELQRNQHLAATGSTSQQALDKAIREATIASDSVKQFQAKLASAKLPARIDLIHAAQASLDATRAQLEAAKWTLQQTTIRAPENGEIFDHYYWPGEQVPAQQPVVSLLIPQDIRIIFYIPETRLSQTKLGQTITFTTDGSKKVGKAIISFISPQAEYTPPVIYSRESQQKQIYRIEAKFATDTDAMTWHPGQPVNITLATPS